MKTQNRAQEAVARISKRMDTAAVTPAAQSTDLIAQLRSAASLDDAMKILAPDAKPKPRIDAVYELNPTCSTPPARVRGACGRVFATAVRKASTFTAQDIADALPDLKSAKYWTRRLAKDGLFRIVETN